VVRLGLIWVDCELKYVDLKFTQLIKTKFSLFLLSLYYIFVIISLLYLVSLVHVYSKCLVFLVILYLAVVFTHASLYFFPHFMLITLIASLGLFWGFYVLFLISC